MAEQSLTAVQWLSWLFFVVGIGTNLWYELRRETNMSAIPFLLVATHGAVFYLALFLASTIPGWLPPWNQWMDFQQWSAALRLHAALTIAAVFAIEGYEQYRIRRLLARVNGHGYE